MSTEEHDPGLGEGWVFFGEVKKYMAHLDKHWAQPQEVCGSILGYPELNNGNNSEAPASCMMQLTSQIASLWAQRRRE
jgi:hypothetical protein